LAGDNPHHDNGVRIKDEPIRTIGTCIGDTVNLASRIEEYTKEALRPLLIDENTRKGLPEHFKVEESGGECVCSAGWVEFYGFVYCIMMNIGMLYVVPYKSLFAG
jgi:hypothetical protein